MMDIGEVEKTIVIEPLEIPVPGHEREPAPSEPVFDEPAPVEVPVEEPVLVPA